MPLFVIGCPQQVDERIFDLTAELLQKFERRDANLRFESIHVTVDEKTDSHDSHPLALLGSEP